MEVAKGNSVESPAKTTSRHIGGETIMVICFVVLTSLYFYQTFRLQRTMMSDLVGPALFPQIIAGLGLLLSVIYFFQRARSPSPEGSLGSFREELANLLPVVPIIIYVLLLEPIGFLFSTAIYVFLAMLFYGRPVGRALLAAVIMSVSFFILFYYALLTTIPMGWFIQTDRLMPFLVQLRRAMGAY